MIWELKRIEKNISHFFFLFFSFLNHDMSCCIFIRIDVCFPWNLFSILIRTIYELKTNNTNVLVLVHIPYDFSSIVHDYMPMCRPTLQVIRWRWNAFADEISLPWTTVIKNVWICKKVAFLYFILLFSLLNSLCCIFSLSPEWIREECAIALCIRLCFFALWHNFPVVVYPRNHPDEQHRVFSAFHPEYSSPVQWSFWLLAIHISDHPQLHLSHLSGSLRCEIELFQFLIAVDWGIGSLTTQWHLWQFYLNIEIR